MCSQNCKRIVSKRKRERGEKKKKKERERTWDRKSLVISNTLRVCFLCTFKGLRKDLRKGETGFWDRVTHIEIRGCLLIPIACAPFSSLLSGSTVVATATARSVALSLSLAAHKHANEDIPPVYTRGPVDGGQRLISVSPTLPRVGIVFIHDRPRYIVVFGGRERFVNPVASSSYRLFIVVTSRNCDNLSHARPRSENRRVEGYKTSRDRVHRRSFDGSPRYVALLRV